IEIVRQKDELKQLVQRLNDAKSAEQKMLDTSKELDDTPGPLHSRVFGGGKIVRSELSESLRQASQGLRDRTAGAAAYQQMIDEADELVMTPRVPPVAPGDEPKAFHSDADDQLKMLTDRMESIRRITQNAYQNRLIDRKKFDDTNSNLDAAEYSAQLS